MGFQACDQCSSIKQKCDGQEPCQRCMRLNLDCSHLRSRNDKNAVSSRPTEAPRKFRAGIVRRDRTGCDTCKKRKKKCDELLPKCSDCRRLNLPCTRTVKPKISRQQKATSPSASIPSSARSSVSEASHSQSLISEVSYTSHPVPLLSPPISAISPTNSSELMLLEPVTPSPPMSRPFYHWLSTVTHPPSSDASSDVMVYESTPHVRAYVPFEEVVMPEIFLEDSCATSAAEWIPMESVSIPYSLSTSAMDQLSNHQDRHLFQHYINVVSRSLCIASSDNDNPFLKLIIPLASASTAVMGALLKLSAVHLKHNGGYPDVVNRGLDHQTKALSALNNLIASGATTGFFKEQALAAILLFCIIDIREGNSSRWSWHIAAAKAVITSNESSTTHTSSWPFLLDIFEYVDSIITVSKCKPPLIDHQKLRPDTSIVSSSTLKHNAIFGVARPLFRLIGEVSALSNKRKHRIKPLFDTKFRQQAAVINAKLRAWEPPIPMKENLSKGMSIADRDLLEAAHAATAIKWGAILRLHQIVDGYSLPHPVPSTCLANILSSISEIRPGSPVESLTVFPLIMAGSVSLDKEDRMTVRSRWLIMEQTIGFGNIAKGGRMLEEVWGMMDEEIAKGDQEGVVRVNWASVRWYEFGELVLF